MPCKRSNSPLLLSGGVWVTQEGFQKAANNVLYPLISGFVSVIAPDP